MLDIRELTAIAHYFIVATVDNERQAQAIEDEVLEKRACSKTSGLWASKGIQNRGSGWALLDFGDVIVHLFTEEAAPNYSVKSCGTRPGWWCAFIARRYPVFAAPN